MKQDELEELLKPFIVDMGYEFWGCEYLPQGKYAVLRIYIDKKEGIGITDCELVSQQLSAFLDVEDPIPGHYNLEISSPGLSRTLFNPEQYKRYIGHLIKIKLYQPIAKHRTLVGEIMAVEGKEVLLKLENSIQNVLFSNVVRANLIDE